MLHVLLVLWLQFGNVQQLHLLLLRRPLRQVGQVDVEVEVGVRLPLSSDPCVVLRCLHVLYRLWNAQSTLS